MVKYTWEYTGEAEEVVIAAAGTIEIKLYGGAGAGSKANVGANSQNGGPGGFTIAEVDVEEGDVLRFEVGQGGRRPVSTTVGGAGGWPDGGGGGHLGNTHSTGGGGGSTRIYLNDVLILVAGGGGSCGTLSSAQNAGGSGGGSSGQDGGTGGTPGVGGSQVAGGSVGGDFLQGGGVPNPASANTAFGAGGGGYYGGGRGATQASSGGAAGAGGSGYVHPSLDGDTYTSLDAAAPNAAPYPDIDLPEGIAVGGIRSTNIAQVTSGGDGIVIIHADPGIIVIPSPGDAEGPIGQLDLTPPEAEASGPGEGEGDIGTVALTAPEADVSVRPAGELPEVVLTPPEAEAVENVIATGELPTILVESRIEASPEREADVIVPIDVEVTIFAELEAAVEAEVDISPQPLPPVVLSPPIPSIEADAPADLEAEVQLEAPEGYAGEAVEAELTSTVVVSSLLEAVAVGAGTGLGAVPAVALTAPEASVQTDDMDTVVALPELQLVPPNGAAYGDVIDVVPQETDPVVVLPPEATAAGNAFVDPPRLTGAGLPQPIMVVRRNRTPEAFAEGFADIAPSISPPTVFVEVPIGQTERGFQIGRPLNTVWLAPPEAYAGDDPYIPVTVFPLEIPEVVLTPPEAVVAHGHHLEPELPQVDLFPPEAAVDEGAEIAGLPLAPIIVSPPEAFAGFPLVIATGDMEPLVVRLSPLLSAQELLAGWIVDGKASVRLSEASRATVRLSEGFVAPIRLDERGQAAVIQELRFRADAGEPI